MSPLLQDLGRRAAGALGRDSLLVRALRPAYELLLDAATLGKGYVRVVNGVEPFYVKPAWRRFFPDVYEPEVYGFLRAHVAAGQTCVNVGAAIGVYALSLARWVGPAGRVVAFEPNDVSREMFAGLARRNGLADRITILPDAVGAAESTATLYRHGGATYSRLDEPSPMFPGSYETETVHIVTLDSWLAAHDVRPDWIVADIEGYEVAMLEGARRTIAAGKGRLRLVVETHPYLWESAGTSRAAFERLLEELGLRATRLLGGGDPLAEPAVVLLEYR